MSEYTKGQHLKVRTDYDGCNYITAGVQYDAVVEQGGVQCALIRITDDTGSDIRPIIGAGSDHLDGNYWEVVS